MTQKKICVLTTLYPPIIKGGAEISTAALCEGLAKIFNVKVVTLSEDNSFKRESINGVNVVRVPIFNLGHYENRPKHGPGKLATRLLNWIDGPRHLIVRREIEEFDPDAIQLNNLNLLAPRIGSVLKKKNRFLVQTVRDLRPLCDKFMIKKGAACVDQCGWCRIRKRRVRDAFRNYDHVVGISRSILRPFIENEYVAEKNTSVIYNGVKDLSRSRGAIATTARVRVGFMGNLVANKGIDLILEVARQLPGVQFHIATHSAVSDVEFFKSRASGNIKIVGFQQPDEFFNSVEIAIVPSKWAEPFGRVAAEAMSAGCVTLVSDRGALPEIVQDDVTGRVIPYQDTQSWVKVISELVTSPAERLRLSKAGRERYLSNFTDEIMVERYLELFEHGLSQKNL